MASTSTETIAGCRIRVLRGGRGAPLVFLHGAGGAMWLPFMDALAKRFEVIVPEHPGFGESETPSWLDNIGDLAYFYLDVLETLDLGRVHLMGGSLGGWIAAELAVRSCANLASLTLAAPAGIHVKGVRKGDVFLWTPEESIRRLYFDQAIADRLLAMPATEAQQQAQMKNRLMLARLAWQPRFYNPHLAKWLHRIAVPTLVVWGENDEVLPAAYGAAYAALIPGAQLVTFPACGHLPQVEKPEAFESAVNRFLAGAVP